MASSLVNTIAKLKGIRLPTGNPLDALRSSTGASPGSAAGTSRGAVDSEGRVSREAYYGTGQGSTLSAEARNAVNPLNQNAQQALQRRGMSATNMLRRGPSMSGFTSATSALRGMSGARGGLI